MPWTPAQSGNLQPTDSRFFPQAVIIANPGSSQSLAGATGSGIFIPFSNLESYKVATSGDVRELLYSIVDKVYNGIASLSGLPGQPKPTNVTIARTLTSTGDTTSQKRFTVTVGLNALNTQYDVEDE